MFGELIHVQPMLGGELELDQYVVFRERHPLARDQLGLQLAQHRRLGVEEGAPGAKFGRSQRRHMEYIAPADGCFG